MRAILSTACVVMMILSTCHAQQQQEVQIQIDSLRVERVDRQQIQAEIVLSATAPRDLHLDRIALSNIHVNGVPVFADPVEADIKTTGGSVVLPTMNLHVYLEDIRNAGELEQVLREQQASVSAIATVEMRTNLLQRLFLGEAHPVAMWEVRKTVPIHVAHGLTGRGISLLLMTGIDLARPLARAFTGLTDASVTTTNDTALVRTCWIPPQAERRCMEHVAFWAGSRYLTAAQAVEPWRFDPLLSRSAPADSSSVEVTLEVGAVTIPVTARIFGTPKPKRVLLMLTRSWSSYADAESRDVYAELQPAQPIPTVLVPLPANAVACSASSWQDARVYRLPQDGRGASPIGLMVRTENGSLRFSRPLGNDTIGSPIIGANGVIGIVQSEHTGAAIARPGNCPAI